MGVRLPRGDFRPLGLSLIRCARPMDGRTMAYTPRSGAGGPWEMDLPSLREKFFHIHAAAKKGADPFRCTRAAGKRILFPSGGMRGKRMLLMKRSGHPSPPPPIGRRGLSLAGMFPGTFRRSFYTKT